MRALIMMFIRFPARRRAAPSPPRIVYMQVAPLPPSPLTAFPIDRLPH